MIRNKIEATAMKKTGKRDEKGSALLLTLGILSLALILGMSFAFSARTSRQVAKVNADQVKAKLLAESCMERVFASMKLLCRSLGSSYPASQNLLNMNDSKMESGSGDYLVRYGVSKGAIGPDKSDATEDNNSFGNILLRESSLATYFNGIDSLELDDAGFQTVTDSDNKIVGRFGFMIMEESGKVDRNRILTLRKGDNIKGNIPFVKEGESKINGNLSLKFDPAKDFCYPILKTYFSSSFDPDTIVKEDNTLRMGIHPMEIRAASDDYLDKLKNGYIGDAATKIQWFSYDHLRNVIGDDFKDDFYKYTFFSLDNEPESWIDESSDNDYSRFDITGYELGEHTDAASFYDSDKLPQQGNDACIWPSSSDVEDVAGFMDDILGTPKGFPTAQTAIPWLSKMKDRDGNDVKQQVVANMIDFCDKDSIPTRPWKSDKSDYEDQYTDEVFSVSGSSFTIGDDDISAPAFWGNEKVAYINEINLKFLVMRTPTDLVEYKNYNYQIVCMPQIELADVYDDATIMPSKVNIRLCGTITVNNNYTDELGHNDAERFKCSQTDNAANLRFECNAIGTFSSDGFAIAKLSGDGCLNIPVITNDPYKHTAQESIPGENPGDPPTIVTHYLPGGVDVEIIINKIVVMSLDSSDKPHDYAYFEKAFSATFNIPDVQNLTQVSEREWYRVYEISLECADSRFNHKTSGWTDKTDDSLLNPGIDAFESDFSDLANYGNYDSLNAFNAEAYADKVGSLTEGTDYDKEANADSSIKYSTAFIKDAPFDSLWELGCIHRGEPFTTINLKKYIAVDDADTDKGKYSLGDAAILDQVKIGPSQYGYKYNANSQNKGVLENVILDKINKSDDYENPSDSGSFSGTLDFTGFTPSYSRADLANTISGSFDNDREAEAYIGRTANLLGTRYDAFTLFIVAQPMAQLQENGETVWTDEEWGEIKKTVVNPTKFTHGATVKYCSILGTQVIVVQFVRDTWTNKFTVLHKHYANND